MIIRYCNAKCFNSHHFDISFCIKDLYWINKNHKQKQNIIKIGFWSHPYQLVRRGKHIFNDLDFIRSMRRMFEHYFMLSKTIDDELQNELKIIIYSNNKNYLKIKKWIKWLFGEIHVNYRLQLWGFLIPSIEYKQWLNKCIYDVIYDINGDLQIIPIPFYQGTVSMDDSIKNFLNLSSDYLPLENVGHKCLDQIISCYESLHAYVFL